MPRPTNRTELLALSEANLEKLFNLIDSLPQDSKTREYTKNELNDRDRTVADVLCHLHEWHAMMLRWYETGMSGKKPAIPAEDVTWQTLPILNRRIYEKYRGTSLEVATRLLRQSHREVMKLIQRHSDGELFTKKRYPWTGTTSLGAYLVSATSSHYDWALKTIKPLKKLTQF